MQIQRISGYTNKCSTNSRQQANIGNPNFAGGGMHYNRSDVAELVGREHLEKFIDFTKAWIKGQYSILFPNNEFNQVFKLVFYRDHEGRKALVGSVGDNSCFATARLSHPNISLAAENAVKEASVGWLQKLKLVSANKSVTQPQASSMLS